MPKPTVAVGMSGGADSSAACLLLIEQGFNVFGITMEVLPGESYCSNLTAVEDARLVCQELGIPHYIADLRKQFESEVITAFKESYYQGRTPNPCLICNVKFKFGYLLDETKKLGADYLATGHYVQVGKIVGTQGQFVESHLLASGKFDGSSDGEGVEYLKTQAGSRFLLARGVDGSKDQSYALYGLDQTALSSVLFPLGSLEKQKVRKILREKGLSVAQKPESQDICFVPKKGYTALFHQDDKIRPGPIVDTSGKVLGYHKGLAYYTIGQRRGLGVQASYPLYVVKIDADANQIIVGKKEESYAKACYVAGMNFIMTDYPNSQVQATCMVRYRGKEVGAVLIPQWENCSGEGVKNKSCDDVMLVKFDEPQFAVTPGQSLVLYKGRFVYGGGVIIESR